MQLELISWMSEIFPIKETQKQILVEDCAINKLGIIRPQEKEKKHWNQSRSGKETKKRVFYHFELDWQSASRTESTKENMHI